MNDDLPPPEPVKDASGLFVPSNVGEPPPGTKAWFDAEASRARIVYDPPRRYEYEYEYVAAVESKLNEMGALGWRVVPGSRDADWWLMERRVP